MIGERRINTQLGYLSADDIGRPIEVGGKALGSLIKVEHHADTSGLRTTVTTVDADRRRRESYETSKPAVVIHGSPL